MSGNPESLAILLGELLCARVCHDLAGPIGAVGSGAELLADEMGPGNEALALLVDSAAAAGSRLRYLRLALGGGGKAMRPQELHQTTIEYLASAASGARPSLDWQDGVGEPWEPGAARLLMNLILTAHDCLPRGGALTVRGRPAPRRLATVTAEGRGAMLGEAALQLTEAAPTTYGPRGAQGRYAVLLAAQMGIAVRVEKEDALVSFVAERKD